VEALASGLPVIASDLGALAELIAPGQTGLLFTPGSAEDLSAKVEWMLTHPELVQNMRRNARREYEQRYTASSNYQMLRSIYEQAQTEGHNAPVRTRPAAA
jgi:glycosyltransferase involved in cell wall biosynthesis